jgi:hypothetical protein
MFTLLKKIRRRLKKFIQGFFGIFRKERQPYSEFIRLFHYYNGTGNPAEVLLLGDSVAERVSWSDFDDRTLVQFIILNLKGMADIVAVSYGGFTLKVFYHFVLALEKMKNRPGMVVLPINMRNFSPQWDLEPAWQFQEEVELINGFISNPLMSPSLNQLKNEVLPTEMFNAFDATPVNYNLSPLNRIGHFRLLINSTPATEEQKKFRLSQIFIYHYTHALMREHPKVMFLENTLKLLQKMGIPFFAYLTPLNAKAGERLIGNSFSNALHDNVRVVSDLVDSYCTDGISVFKNWSEMLDSKYFFYPDNATEHLNEIGRCILASSIADEVKDLLKQQRSAV